MDGKVLVIEANAMKNPPNQSNLREPLKWSFFIPKIDLSESCQKKTGFFEFFYFGETHKTLVAVAEGVGFEPTLGLLLSLISSQVPSTTQPPFLRLDSIA
jgi:hypothetical protein